MEQELILPQIKLKRPHPGQQLVLQSKARFRVLCCGRRWGKSTVCKEIAVKKMMEGKRVAYLTHKYFLSTKLFREYAKLFPESTVAICNKSELLIELVNGGSIQFMSANAGSSFRGLEFDTAICDEAAHFLDFNEVWEGELLPTLAITEGDAIIISTPRGRNGFYGLYVQGLVKDDPDNEFESFHFPSNNNPRFSQKEFEKRKKSMSDAKFNEEYLAIPGENQSNPFSSEAVHSNTIKELSRKPPVVFGIDLAKYKDWTVICGLDEDGAMCHFQRFQCSWTVTEERIIALPRNVLKIIDGTGVGDPIVERIQRSTHNVRRFVFTGESKPRIIQELITDLEKGMLKVNEHTANELLVFEFSYSASGHLKFEAQQGFHDDAVLALSLANQGRGQAAKAKNFRLYTA